MRARGHILLSRRDMLRTEQRVNVYRQIRLGSADLGEDLFLAPY